MTDSDQSRETPAEGIRLIEGLTNPQTLSLERFLIRTRGTAPTQSAWKLAVSADEGQGWIVLVEADFTRFYRGEGMFLGWSQGRLESAYQALLPREEGPQFEIHQLG